MDIGRAFGYVTEDERWVTKILLGGVILLIPIIGALAMLGFVVQTARNVAQGSARPMPDWSDFGEKLRIGFGAFVVAIVYYLPLFVIGCVLGGLGGVLAGSSDSGEASGVAGLLLACVQILVSLGSIAMYPFIFAALVRYIQSGDIATALRFNDVITMVRSAPGTWIMLTLVYLLTQIVGSLGIIACFVGLIFTLPYSQAVFAHLLGQVTGQTSGLSGYTTPPTPPSYTPPTYQ